MAGDEKDLGDRRPLLARRSVSSFASTFRWSQTSWSTNMTMSNLIGPGRVLGNIYSNAGRSLERGFGILAHKAGFGPAASAERLSVTCEQRYMKAFRSEEDFKLPPQDSKVFLKSVESECSKLLKFAGNSVPSVQLAAFQQILNVTCRHAILHCAFQHCYAEENSPIEALTFSWKRRDVEYDDQWLLYYRLAILCLTDNVVTNIVDELVEREVELVDKQITLTYKLVDCCSLDTQLGLVAIRFLAGLLDDARYSIRPRLNQQGASASAVVAVIRAKLVLQWANIDDEGLDKLVVALLGSFRLRALLDFHYISVGDVMMECKAIVEIVDCLRTPRGRQQCPRAHRLAREDWYDWIWRQLRMKIKWEE